MIDSVVVIDWLFAVRCLGLDWANALEDRRLIVAREEGREVPIIEILACELIEECDLAGTTYDFEGALYFMPWAA